MNRETVMDALFNLLTNGVASTFTGTVPGDSSNTILGISSLAGLFVGFPVVGPPGVDATATIATIDTAGNAISLLAAVIPGGEYTFQTGFRTTGRRVQFATAVADQPAMFLRNVGDDVSKRPTGMPAKVTMEAEIWLYSNAGADPDVAPSVALNYLIDAVEAVLNPFPRPTQTLGGLVHHCWIEGKIQTHPGDLDGQAIAVIPVKILVPTLN